MAITYSVTQLVDPREPEVAGKFYAKAQASGLITIDDLADDISYSTTLTDGDVRTACTDPFAAQGIFRVSR